jgi:hypothetical protein
MYKVIKYFTDLEDNEFPYNVGDSFPREGKEVTEERIAVLASARNKQRTPLIKKIEEPKEEKKPEEAPKPEKAAKKGAKK